MHSERSALVVASVAIVLTVANVPGLAQSNAVRWRTTTPSDPTIDLATSAVGVYVEPYAAEGVVAPPNLSVPSIYRTTVELMIERSSMFRRQCVRLAAATHLTVIVNMLHPNNSGPRAQTEIKRENGGRLVATASINPHGDFTELLAHELEHVIEQLDGIDLAAKASVARSGVRSCVDGTFETSRAVRVGSVVAVQSRR